MENGFLFQAIIYLLAAVVCVPLAKKIGMGSVLGYLLAGIIIGPYVFGFIGEEGEDIMHFAEFGVVMMLFLIGLELEPSKLWKMRQMITRVGLSQVLVTTLAFFGILYFMGLGWRQALAISTSLALSSTAITLQSLKEKDQMNSSAGRNSFAVLLMQDIAVIPILAVLPLIALAATSDVDLDHMSPIAQFPGWLQTLFVFGAVILVIVSGRYFIIPMLKLVAKTRLRELFVAGALLIVLGIAFLMEMVGLSPALGTFLGGVILANSQFKHELESDLEPFKGLLLGLFFIAVGASINFGLIGENALMVFAATLSILLIKSLILFGIGKVNKISTDQTLIFALGLSQVGEFAFVTFSFATELNIINAKTTEILMAVTAISMTFTPLLLLFNERLLLPYIGTKEKEEKPHDEMDESNKVILAGFSNYGSTVGRFLRANGIKPTILDSDSDRVNLLRKMGFEVFYGDVTRADLLEMAGAREATILISAIRNPETNYRLVTMVKKHFPNLELMVRAKDKREALELLDLEVPHIYMQNLESAVRMGKDVLIKMGFRAHTVHRLAQDFIKYDEDSLVELAKVKNDKKAFISTVRKSIEMQENLLSFELNKRFSLNDHAWDSDTIKEGEEKNKE
ncbi:monovalent cation:proton antiporter-2 (CPA2) family protein [Cyclobacterium qasimii]|uniref:Glutathione-regulated potassium-efflux system protein KefC n=2 Tax=Cyclobacterium qasimii TaxID=1350429 RepID=S7X680_9BACT|nr:monovalent cation:proton antiporter-2 (CPA2) family protein [Cyclobacterium qasimii]EPR71568.1 Glutathione-regulated potassium-efflux system protein KefC [Cyclobacterium qasimii M12-11B]GEO20275.1 potassium transporter [Cyclobacterium qasimii]